MSGSHYERELANHLDSLGFKVIRAPTSGGGTKRDLPDLFWSKPNEQAIAAELKTRSREIAYVSHDEIESLTAFAMAFNAKPRLILRVKGDTSYYVIKPENGHHTDESVRIERSDAEYTIDP